MRTLIVGVGALGGVIAARLHAATPSVCLAARNAAAAAGLKLSGLRVTGVGGELYVEGAEVRPLDGYTAADPFELIVLATKAREAFDLAPQLPGLLAPEGTLLPIQNGAVSQLLADRLGPGCVLGGVSNLGATMTAPGVYEQRNAGHLMIGELAGGESDRARRVRQWLGRAVEVRVTSNVQGAIWSKLLLNCSVTTIGAIAGRTMREYIALPGGREVFNRTYDEALSVALANGVRPERMIVDPVPPASTGRSVPGEAHEAWLGRIVQAYGDLKASMLQDFERGRTTEIDYINGHVVNLGRQCGVPTPVNAAIVEAVRAITRRQIAPGPALLPEILWAGLRQSFPRPPSPPDAIPDARVPGAAP